MEAPYKHKVLIVDDEEFIGKSIGRAFKKHHINYLYINSGDKALELIKQENTSFSLILSDHQMPGMKGTQFLEQARIITPKSIRFLITAYTEIPIIIDAVNKGSINRFISKPWDYKDLIAAVKYGLKQFEIAVDNERLELLEKEQNNKLFELSCSLMEKTKQHNDLIKKMDERMLSLKQQMKDCIKIKNQKISLEDIEQSFESLGLLEKNKFNEFYKDSLYRLYEHFQTAAQKNSIDISSL